MKLEAKHIYAALFVLVPSSLLFAFILLEHNATAVAWITTAMGCILLCVPLAYLFLFIATICDTDGSASFGALAPSERLFLAIWLICKVVGLGGFGVAVLRNGLTAAAPGLAAGLGLAFFAFGSVFRELVLGFVKWKRLRFLAASVE